MHTPLFPLVLLALTACADEARLESGTWSLYEAMLASGDVLPGTGSIELDLDAETALVLDATGAEVADVGIALLPRADWPEGCPTNFSSTRMEVAALDLDTLELDIGDGVVVTLAAPTLVASCPDGDPLLLRDGMDGDGMEIGSTGCAGAESCLAYEPAG